MMNNLIDEKLLFLLFSISGENGVVEKSGFLNMNDGSKICF